MRMRRDHAFTAADREKPAVPQVPAWRTRPARLVAGASRSRFIQGHHHVSESFALLGGGVKEPGWLNTQPWGSRGDPAVMTHFYACDLSGYSSFAYQSPRP